MKPIYILAPYWMGDFSPTRAAIARHTWRLITPAPAEGEPMERMGILAQHLADEVTNVRQDGNLPVAIVGDCTFSIGVLAALQRENADLTLVWYDAHGDFNTPETTPTDFVGGMPLAMLCGRGDQTIMEGAGAEVHPEENVILVDGRHLDEEEAKAVAQSGIQHLSVADLLEADLPADKPIYLHFDSDVLSTEDLSAVSHKASGGPSLEALEDSLSRLAQTGQVVAVSVTMWNPELDDADKNGEHTVLDMIDRFVEQAK